jgi:hypothetical protein
MTQQTKVLLKKGTLQIICPVVPIRQDIAYSFCFTGAEREIHKNKDDGKIERETNLDRRGPSQIGTVGHIPETPTFWLPTTFLVVVRLHLSINKRVTTYNCAPVR